MSASNVRLGHMSPNKPISDTMPKRGKVTEMCKEWLVHEDGALAYKLQQEEVDKHYSGNKSRNAIVREDFPKALDEQRKAQEEAMADYLRRTRLLEERDARVAKEIAAQLEREEEEKRRRLEVEDRRMAKIMQQDRDKKTGIPSLQGDINAVGLPPPPSNFAEASCSREAHYENLPPPPAQHRPRRNLAELEKQFRRMLHEQDAIESVWPPPPDPEQISKANQEKADEELAKKLQLEEQSAEFDMEDRDRMLAIEVQDAELAKMLQEKEKARLRRAKEKARAKALGRQKDETVQTPQMRDVVQNDTGEIVSHEQIVNIATAIDPTYVPPKNGSVPRTPPRTNTVSSSSMGALRHSPCHNGPDNILLDDAYDDTPPYMPVQGQRRISSMEKKKKKGKEGDCKQQ